MYPIKNLTHAKIQRELWKSLWSVDSILKSLGIDNQVTPQKLYSHVKEELKNMKFTIKYDKRLCSVLGNQSVAAFTIFNTSNRTDGGIILLNPDYSIKERIENLIHEYVHIKDYSLPLSTTHDIPFENKAIFHQFFTDIDKVLGMNQEHYKFILDDLKKRNFEIKYGSIQKFPAFTKFNTSNRADGGTIMLSRDFSTNELLEALFYEYVSIIDYSLPIYEISAISPDYKVMVDKFYQELVEFQADMRTYVLLMPPDEMRQCLLENAYNIDNVLRKYHFLEKSAVLQWIAINSGIPCHFSWVLYGKDNNNKIVLGLIHDNFYYRHPNDPQPFGIEAVLGTKDSAAAQAISDGKPVNKQSIINGKEYYCYAYYEADQSKELRKNVISESSSIRYDRLLVIGWEKAVYDTIQHFLKLFDES